MRFISVKDLYFLSVILLIKLMSWSSSFKLKELVVGGIAFLAYHISRNKRRLVEKNLFEAFDSSLTEGGKRKIVKGVFYAFWKHMFSWLPSNVEIATIKEAKLLGIEHLYIALQNGIGAILWESHGFGERIIAKRILHENRFSIHQVHGATDLGGFLTENSTETWVQHSLVKGFFNNCELKFVAEIINLPSSNSLAFTRTLLNLLRQNAIICITGDGKIGQKLIPLKFLGQTEFFSTGMISLSKISGAPILPMFCTVEKNDKTDLVIEHPIKVEENGDREHGVEISVAKYAALLEAYIRQYPEQYRNWHIVGELPKD